MMRNLIVIIICILFNQVLNAYGLVSDSVKVNVKKVDGKLPGNYDISDVIVKRSPKSVKLNIVRVTIGLPGYSMLILRVKDSTDVEIMNLIKDMKMDPGKYIIQWEMRQFPTGKYWCEFETEHFIYRKDFYIK